VAGIFATVLDAALRRGNPPAIFNLAFRHNEFVLAPFASRKACAELGITSESPFF
jgi:hypothetical protein